MTDSGEFNTTLFTQDDSPEIGTPSWAPASVAAHSATGGPRSDDTDATGDGTTGLDDADGDNDEEAEDQDGDEEDGESIVERRRRTLRGVGAPVAIPAAWKLDPNAAAAWRHVLELLQESAGRNRARIWTQDQRPQPLR